jgi:hypothetical protein
MRGLHWWTLIAGMAIGYLVLPTVVGFVRSKMG